VSSDHERRARSFGANAELYDRARPSYPPELVEAVLAESATTVLDVGCGTGKAGRLFAARGCDVLGVEPDPAMAALARAHGLTVEVARFEEWDAAGRQFGLAICAQAWHWIDDARAVPTLAEALPPGGRFAAFWNFGDPRGAAAAAADAVYERIAPHVQRATGALALGVYHRDPGNAAAALVEHGGFTAPELLSFRWDASYSTAEYLDQLRTQSDHALLDEAVREELLAGVEAAIAAAGGVLVVAYETAGFVVRRA
jgi:SAM-dependent methyltransferase